MIILQDVLLACKYKKRVYDIPLSQGIGTFLELDIGRTYDLAEDAGKHGRVMHRGHCMWLDNHGYSSSDIPTAVARATRYDAIALKYPNTRYYISAFCEHHLDAQTALKAANALKAAAPHCTVVNTPLKGGAIVPGVINEFHHAEFTNPDKINIRSELCAFSYDGTDAADSDVEKYYKAFLDRDAHYFGIWRPRYNGKMFEKDSTPRPRRTDYPKDAKYMLSCAALGNPKGAAKLTGHHLYKVNSEESRTDKRANKPVYICPIKTTEVTFKRNGKRIITLPYYGKYVDGRFRYYASKWGYEILKDAGGMVDVVINGKKFGVIDPAFRENEYRDHL